VFAVGSLLVSAASGGFVATTFAYDMDISPSARMNNPEWLGLVPDQGRGKAFTVMLILTTLQVLAKGVSTAFLVATNSTWLLAYLVVDNAVYLAYKLIRRDFIYFFPIPRGPAIVVSCIMRSGEKIIADFSGSLAYRLPLLLGGSFFTWNMIASQVSVVVSAHVYNVHYSAAAKLPPAVTLGFSLGVVLLWVAIFVYFIWRIAVPKYRKTFLSTVTGWKMVVDNFLTREADDRARFKVFGYQRLMWEERIGAEVKEWTHARWQHWKRERPEWFRENLVPDEYIPKDDLAALGSARKRRGSAALSIRESLGADDE
jgi:hypothetical protein